MTAEVAAATGYGLMLLVGSVLGMVVWHRRHETPGRWGKRSRRLVRRSLSAADALLVGLVVLSMILLAGIVLHLMGAVDEELSPRVVMVQSVAVHWTVLLVVLLVVRARRTTLRRVFGMHRGRTGDDIRQGALAYLVMLPVVFVYSLVYRLMLDTLGVDLELQDVAQVLTGDAAPAVRTYLLFLGVFLGPIAEEFLFRGILFPVLARRMGTLVSMLLVSALFAGIHLHVPSLLPLFVLSVSLCIGYVYIGSIIVPVVMHMLFNAVNLALAFMVQNT
jgi:membrane protease YdiL (CAAX protease family)